MTFVIIWTSNKIISIDLTTGYVGVQLMAIEDKVNERRTAMNAIVKRKVKYHWTSAKVHRRRRGRERKRTEKRLRKSMF